MIPKRTSDWFTDSIALQQLELHGRITIDEWYLGTVHHCMRIYGISQSEYLSLVKTPRQVAIIKEAYRIWKARPGDTMKLD